MSYLEYSFTILWPVGLRIFRYLTPDGIRCVQELFPDLWYVLPDPNEYWLRTSVVFAWCSANENDVLLFELVYPLVGYLYEHAPVARLDYLSHFFASLRSLKRKRDLRKYAMPVLDRLARYFFEGVPCYLSYLASFDFSQLVCIGDYESNESHILKGRFPCLPSGDRRPWLTGSSFGAMDPQRCVSNQVSFEPSDSPHNCFVEYGGCQRLLGSSSSSRRKFPMVPFYLLVHLIRHHASFADPELSYFLFFLEASDFIPMLYEYVFPLFVNKDL